MDPGPNPTAPMCYPTTEQYPPQYAPPPGPPPSYPPQGAPPGYAPQSHPPPQYMQPQQPQAGYGPPMQVPTMPPMRPGENCPCDWCRLPPFNSFEALQANLGSVFFGGTCTCGNVERLRSFVRAYQPGMRCQQPGVVPYLNILLIGRNGAGKSSTVNNIVCTASNTHNAPTVDFAYSLLNKEKKQNVTNQLNWIPVPGTKIRIGDMRGLKMVSNKGNGPDTPKSVREAVSEKDEQILEALLQGRLQPNMDIFDVGGFGSGRKIRPGVISDTPLPNNLPHCVVFVQHSVEKIVGNFNQSSASMRGYISKTNTVHQGSLMSIMTHLDWPDFEIYKDGQFASDQLTLKDAVMANPGTKAMVERYHAIACIPLSRCYYFANPTEDYGKRDYYSEHAVMQFLVEAVMTGEMCLENRLAKLQTAHDIRSGGKPASQTAAPPHSGDQAQMMQQPSSQQQQMMQQQPMMQQQQMMQQQPMMQQPMMQPQPPKARCCRCSQVFAHNYGIVKCPFCATLNNIPR